MRQAVIFDMDGVLVNSEPYALANRVAFCHIAGVDADEATFLTLLGANMADVWSQIAPDKDPQRLQTAYLAYKDAHPVPYSEALVPGVFTVLQWLKAHKIKTAIASASDPIYIEKMLSETQLGSFFDSWVSGTDFVQTKPAPDVYLAAMDALGVKAGEAIAVEDSTVGIAAAKNAGLVTFAVPILDERFSADQSAADIHLDNFVDLIGKFVSLD